MSRLKKKKENKALRGMTGGTGKEAPDLTKMKKKDILEIMLAQGEEIDRLRAQVAELEEKLRDRELLVEECGSLAEASIQVTTVFEEAQKAADIYLENIRRRHE